VPTSAPLSPHVNTDSLHAHIHGAMQGEGQTGRDTQLHFGPLNNCT
jgi:hypothetical protein